MPGKPLQIQEFYGKEMDLREGVDNDWWHELHPQLSTQLWKAGELMSGELWQIQEIHGKGDGCEVRTGR